MYTWCVYSSVYMCACVYSACVHVGRVAEITLSGAVQSWAESLRSLICNEGGDRHGRGEGTLPSCL